MDGLGAPLTYARRDASAIDDDPFWAAVRRRHPDLPVVLTPLPDDEAPPAPQARALPAGLVDEVGERLLADLAHVRAVIADTDVEAGVRGGAAEPALTGPALRWAEAPGGHALLAETAVRGLGLEAGTDLLRRLARSLDPHGWRFAPARRGGFPLLRGTDGIVDLDAEAGPAAVVIRLATGVLPVADDVRATLVDRLRAEVASWR